MERLGIRTHLNAPEIRLDTWSDLAALANNIHYVLMDKEKCRSYEEEIKSFLSILKPIEYYHAFPGVELCDKVERLFFKGEYEKFCKLVSLILLALHAPNSNYKNIKQILKKDEINTDDFVELTRNEEHFYFEVLFVEDVSDAQKDIIKQEFNSYMSVEDKFVYELVFVKSFEDAIIASMFNFNIKTVIITDFFNKMPSAEANMFDHIINRVNIIEQQVLDDKHLPVQLASTIRNLRSRDLDIFYLSSSQPEKSAIISTGIIDKIFYDFEKYYELHLTIIQNISSHFETPFFDKLKKYSFTPKSTFHALPVARGKSVFQSKWARDMDDFYGKNIFMAESSSTAGGLDSLMKPSGSLKRAMEKAAYYFGSQETYFVTNGTSSSNKIVLQALLSPGDIVLVDHACHESMHYGLISTGAFPIFLNGYDIKASDLAGPIPLKTIKEHLIQLKNQKLLDKVKMLILTNATFDGLVYNVQQYMEEVLAIKPDIIFFWDEAWFAYARCIPHYRLRTAMYSAHVLKKKYESESYQEQYKTYKKEQKNLSDAFILNNPLLPDPKKLTIRVYCTQSTHKTLSCFRQGSMIHVYDDDFELYRGAFLDAFITNSTTSPNYQILASMDIARRQAELEGYELVQNAIELAMIFRQEVNQNEEIIPYFQALGPSELIPEIYRASHVISGYKPLKDWKKVEEAWIKDEFVIDPTRVTLLIKFALSGHELRRILMDRFGIQVNKVSLNSILLQFNIGASRSSVSYLLECLLSLISELKNKRLHRRKTHISPPRFSAFSSKYLGYKNSTAGDLRRAFYDGHNSSLVHFEKTRMINQRIQNGEEIVASSITIPVPPGYPAFLPGQIVTKETLLYLNTIDQSSIMGGFSTKSGLKIFL